MSGLSTKLALVLAAIAFAVAAVGCTEASTPEPAEQPATETPAETAPSGSATAPGSDSSGQALAESKCTMCHTYDRVEQAKKDEAGWTSTIDRMVDQGLVVTDEEKAAILEYLVARDR